MLDELHRRSCAEVEAAYLASGNTLGWRFFTCPKGNLSADTRVAMITLNPGGTTDPPDHPRESSEVGSAYLHESWPGHEPGAAPLQRQVQALFELLNERLGSHPDGEALLEASLTAQFIPFRSRSWKTLENRRECLSFARGLWTRIFEHIQPELVLCIDRRTTGHLVSIIEAKNSSSATVHSLPTGWGQLNADVIRVGDTTVLRFPHLSRFRLFGREASAAYIDEILSAAVRG